MLTERLKSGQGLAQLPCVDGGSERVLGLGGKGPVLKAFGKEP